MGARQKPVLLSFNRGLVSPLGLARIDQKRVAMSADVHINWMPRVLGSMAFRPGLEYLGGIANNSLCKMLEFIFSVTDTALVELTDSLMRVWVNDEVVTRESVGTAVTNGTFTTDLSGWTQADDTGAISSWQTGSLMGLTGNGIAYAKRQQQVSVAAGDIGVQHALRIIVLVGPVTLRVGTAVGLDDYISEAILETGTHSLAFTPNGDFWIEFRSLLLRITLVQQCTIEATGVMTLPTPWEAADLGNVRYDQSGDVLFLCDGVHQQRRIERRGVHSWSIVLYRPEAGPYLTENITPITLTPSDIRGNILIAASAPTFYAEHVGAIFTLTSTGQLVQQQCTAEDTWTDPIRVTGVGTTRVYTAITSGFSDGTKWTIQASVAEPGAWYNVSGNISRTDNGTITHNDALDNQVMYYRIGVQEGDYSSGAPNVALSIATGSIDGVIRVTAFTDNENVAAEVLNDLGGTGATDTWSEGAWSDRQGWPSAVRFHEGRLWWMGKGGIWGSVTDAFDDFDPTVLGDSGTIDRTIGSGPVDTIMWAMSVQRLLMGCQGAEYSIRSSALDEPMTPTDFNIKPASSLGSASVQAVKVDLSVVYVQRNGVRVYELSLGSANIVWYEYSATDLTAMVPELGLPGIIRIAVQRQPDTRLHCVRSDGVVMIGVFDKVEDVICWLLVETQGAVEDVVVLPGAQGAIEDQVYYVVNRTINGQTVRYLEKWAIELDCRGGVLNKQADAFATYTGTLTNVIPGLDHLEGEEVVVWADGRDLSPGYDGIRQNGDPVTQQTYTVSGGQINLGGQYVLNAIIGLPYTGQWRSTKLGYAVSPIDMPFGRHKRMSHLGVILAYAHPKGLRFGSDFDHMDQMPEVEEGKVIDQDEIRTAYDTHPIEFPGEWTTDMRVCLQAQAPRPVTVLAAELDLEISP